MSVYTYRAQPIAIAYGTLIVAFLVTAAVPVMIFHSPGSKSLPAFAWCVLFLLPIMFALGGIAAFLIWRPIAIGDEGIAALAFGRPRTLVRWSAASRAEKVNFHDNFTMRDRTEYWIYSDHSRVRFDDYIDNLDSLVETINSYIQQYQVPAYEVDRGRETRRSPIATLSAVAHGDRLEGTITSQHKF